MPPRDLHILPKIRDSWSFLYVEHAVVDQEDLAIAIHDKNGRVPVPCASLSTLLLGPGTSVTHAAIKTLADAGCSVVWTGEGGVRFYAQGTGETRASRNLLRQAALWSHPHTRLAVIERMYRARFEEPLEEGLTLQQIRGWEGIRVREAYARLSRETGVLWTGRSYDRGSWADADPVNRALSAANSCLYGVCHAALVSAGFSTALGFVHTGKQLSFVYDVADLYKIEITTPVAFRAAQYGSGDLERRVRLACRQAFTHYKLLERIIPDVEAVLFNRKRTSAADVPDPMDMDAALPGGLWNPDGSELPGGTNYADELALLPNVGEQGVPF